MARINWREYFVFLITILLGTFIGNLILDFVPSTGNDTVNMVLAIVVPTFVIYYIWKRWMQKAAQQV